jgi:hypothetical protein
MHTDSCVNTNGQKCDAKGSRKETKFQGFMYRDTTKVEHEMYGYRVIIGGTGIVTKGLKKNLKVITGKLSIDSLHKTAIFGTSHILRKVRQSETGRLSGGDHRWFKRSSREKRPVTRENIIMGTAHIIRKVLM